MREFITAGDVEALVAQGVKQIVLDEHVVLTDLARDRAMMLGLALVDGTRAAASPLPGPGRPAPAATPAVPTRTPTAAPTALGPKPKGCLHHHLEASGSAPEAARPPGAAAGASSGPLVDQLVEAVRGLSRSDVPPRPPVNLGKEQA
jgi:hypothetical protein